MIVRESLNLIKIDDLIYTFGGLKISGDYFLKKK